MKKDLLKLAEKYENNYIIRPLLNLFSLWGISIGSAIDVWLMDNIQKMKKERVDDFFNELSKGNKKLSEVEIQSNDFIHRFVITLQAVINERREEKIKCFARLLKNFPIEKGREDLNDEYELLLNILDDLEYRELEILVILHKYENEFPLEDYSNKLQRASRFWNDFKSEVCNRYSISVSEFDGYISRLGRTGLFKEITGSFLDYAGGKGYLTDLFKKLVNYIIDEV